MKKLVAILVSCTMIFAMAATVFAAAPAKEVTWEDYQQYLIDTAGSNAPDLQEFIDQVMAIDSWEDLDQTVSPWDLMFTTIGLSTWEEFEEGIVKEAAVPGGEKKGGDSPEGESPEGESPEDEAPSDEADNGKKQNVSDLKVSSFTSNNKDSSRPGDEGHIYIGYAITDGELDAENSNWEPDGSENQETGSLGAFKNNIVLDNIIDGEGFTGIRAWGDTELGVTGDLAQMDDSEGLYASDFTGTGAGITAAEGARVWVDELTYLSFGFGRSFAVVENSDLIINKSDIMAFGADPLTQAYDGYYNSAQTSMMLSPPWVLGIQGGIRAVNVLGRTDPSTFIAADSVITAGGWGVVSTDGCTTPQLYFYNTDLYILPECEGGMYSGWKILGYDEEAYGSGYGTYYIGDACESFYGCRIDGATYGSILRGGTGIYEGMETGESFDAADIDGNIIAVYEADDDILTEVNTVWGIMNHGGGTIDFNEGSVWNSAEGTVLCKEADTVWNFNGAELNPDNGIIFQMMDNDDNTVGGFNPFGTYLTEEPGFPMTGYEDAVTYVFTEDQEVDPSKTYYQADTDAEGGYAAVEDPTQEGIIAYYEKSSGGGKVEVNFTSGDYMGAVYNGTGYYDQAADALYVNIAEDAALVGDIALTSHVHGIFLRDRDVDDVISAIDEADKYHENIGGYYEGLDDIEYVFLDADGEITEDKDEAAAIQFTKFSIAEYYLLGHVLNKINNNGLAALDLTVEGTWAPVDCSLVTYLNVAEGAHVFAQAQELEDGSILLTPSDEELEPGEYGRAFVFVAAPGSSGESGAGESAEGESAEGESPEGESPEGESPEGESPEGESPEGESPEDESQAEEVPEAKTDEKATAPAIAEDKAAVPEARIDDLAEVPALKDEKAASAAGDDELLEAYKKYMNEWLIAENEINDAMTDEQLPEFQACIEANDYSQFPGDMFFNGMLESGTAMTFEEFAASQKK